MSETVSGLPVHGYRAQSPGFVKGIIGDTAENAVRRAHGIRGGKDGFKEG